MYDQKSLLLTDKDIPLKFSMDKWSGKGRGRGRASDTDEGLAVVKAAAWAWYQHGPGSDGRPLRELNITSRTSTNRPHRPSRYKLEAMARENKNNLDLDQDQDQDQDRSLLDDYEVKRISLQLDRLIESSSKPEEKRAGSGKKIKRWRGLWGRPRVTCGARDDVVESCRKCAAGKG